MADEKKKRKSPTANGPVTKREMTKVRDEVGAIRDMVKNSAGIDEIEDRLAKLYTVVDRMDLRFRIHADPSVTAAARKSKKPKTPAE